MNTLTLLVQSIALLLGAGALAQDAGQNDNRDSVRDKDALIRFIGQYASIDRLTVHCDVEEEITVQPRPDLFKDVAATGPCSHWCAGEMVKIDSDIRARDRDGAFMTKRLRYAFDGETHAVYSPALGAYQRSEERPSTAVSAAPNPALMPVMPLRPDLDRGAQRDPSDFRDTGLLRSFIRSHEVEVDALGNAYHELEIGGDDDEVVVYRVYLERHASGAAVITRTEQFDGVRSKGLVFFMDYREIRTRDGGSVLLPGRVQMIGFRDNNPFYELIIDVSAYETTTRGDAAFYRFEPPEGTRVVEPERVDGDAADPDQTNLDRNDRDR